MKITYINEAVKLPSKQQKKVTVDDIQNVNLTNYVKPYIMKYVADSLSSNFMTIYDLTPKKKKKHLGPVGLKLLNQIIVMIFLLL